MLTPRRPVRAVSSGWGCASAPPWPREDLDSETPACKERARLRHTVADLAQRDRPDRPEGLVVGSGCGQDCGQRLVPRRKLSYGSASLFGLRRPPGPTGASPAPADGQAGMAGLVRWWSAPGPKSSVFSALGPVGTGGPPPVCGAAATQPLPRMRRIPRRPELPAMT